MKPNLWIALALIVVAAAGCSKGTVSGRTVSLSAVTPAAPVVTAGLPRTFACTASGGASSGVTWSASCGRFSGDVWTAPATAGTCTITAASADDPSVTVSTTATVVDAPLAAGLAASTATPLHGATVTLTPTFSGGAATVGSSGAGSADVAASGTSGVAIITPAVTSARTFTLTVTNAAGTADTASVAVTPQTVSVSNVSPAARTVGPGDAQAFTATVSGGATGALTWSATGGSFSGNTWTSPGTTGTYTITATSADDPTRSASTLATVATWRSVKIGGGGYVPGLVFHPTSANVLYARTDVGGAYRWDAATSSWIALTDGFGVDEGFYVGAESIALDPNDDQRVYMSTGMYNSADGAGRLYVSADRGDHWQHVALPFSVGSNDGGRGMGERMAVDPNLPSTLFYGSRTAGLWKSTDSGRTWTQVGGLSSTRMTADQIAASGGSAKGIELVLLDTSTRGTGVATQQVYVAVAPDYASAAGLAFNLYRSTDGGATWSGVATPVTGVHIPHIARAADGVLYVVFTRGAGPGADGPAALYAFDGTRWTLLRETQPTQWTSFGLGGVSVHGSGPTTRIALGITNSWGNWDGQPVVALSDDAGGTWREIESTMPHTPASKDFSGWVDDVEIDPSDPDHVLHVFGGGIWETRDASAPRPSWSFMVDGIEETCAISIVAPPAGAPYLLLNGSGDVGLLVHTDLSQPPTLGPKGSVAFGNGLSADLSWSEPAYIAAIGSPATGTAAGVYSTDAGVTWAAFPANHPDALANLSGESNIAVMKRNSAVWAPANSVPRYTTDNGATWEPTDLPTIARMTVNRSYRVVADRRNPSKVYAYDSGGAWWGTSASLFYSADGGRTFTRSTDPALSALRANSYQTTSMAVNPYAEGDVWLADGNSLYHSVDSGVTWSRLTTMQSVWGANPTWKFPELFGATVVTLGKAAPGAAYSAAVYLVGTVGGVWGVYRSDDAGATWLRINDDRHQFGGIGLLAADQNVVGRVHASGGGRGIFYTR